MGGYQILDLQSKNFVTGVGVTIKGIYDKIEGNTKAKLLTNIVINNVETADVYLQMTLNGTTYQATVPQGRFDFTQDDLVTFTAN